MLPYWMNFPISQSIWCVNSFENNNGKLPNGEKPWSQRYKKVKNMKVSKFIYTNYDN